LQKKKESDLKGDLNKKTTKRTSTIRIKIVRLIEGKGGNSARRGKKEDSFPAKGEKGKFSQEVPANS